jgi:hypothetical protein
MRVPVPVDLWERLEMAVSRDRVPVVGKVIYIAGRRHQWFRRLLTRRRWVAEVEDHVFGRATIGMADVWFMARITTVLHLR